MNTGYRRVIRALRRLAEMTPQQTEARFRELAAEIWGQDTYESVLRDRIFMMTGEPGGDHLGSVSSNATQRARFGILLQAAPKYSVRFSERFYDLPHDLAEGIIKHEVLHLGYPRHDAAFNAHARRIGAPLTENEALGTKVKVQVKDGARYRTVHEADDEATARAWVKDARSRKDPVVDGKKVRLLF